MNALIVSLYLFTGAMQQPAPADSITLAYCHQQAAENYPTTQNIDLQKRITALNVAIANSGYFPDVTVNGQATYQSEVTEVTLPGSGGPPGASKDQYEASIDVTQNIFTGGSVGKRKDLERAKGQKQVNAIKVDLHKIREQINQVYYGILLSSQQAKTVDLLIENIQKQLSTVRSKVENGVLLPSQQHILEAELINARQDSADIQSNIRAGYQVLGTLIGENISIETKLSLPKVNVDYRLRQPQRPEYDLFESNRAVLDKRQELAETKKLPRLSAFGTAAYGRPGLNFLNDDFHDYYIAGLRVRWDFWDSRNASRERESLKIQQEQITRQQRAFTRQMNASLERIRERIASIRENMRRDRRIIELREQIVEESASQLKYGVITATEYITELTRANQARLSLYINRVRLAQAKTNYITTLGIPQSELAKMKTLKNQ